MKQHWYNYYAVLDSKSNTGQRRYQCDGCHRSYKHQSNLCNHKREECGKEPSYFCPICNKGFKKKQHMQRHVVGIHGIPQPPSNPSNISNTFPLNMPPRFNLPSNTNTYPSTPSLKTEPPMTFTPLTTVPSSVSSSAVQNQLGDLLAHAASLFQSDTATSTCNDVKSFDISSIPTCSSENV